jgi:hypothetical protein
VQIGAAVVLTATVAAPSPGPTPTGADTLYDSNLGNRGTGSLTTSFPTAEVDEIYVVYSGDVNHISVSSANINEVVFGTGTDVGTSTLTRWSAVSPSFISSPLVNTLTLPGNDSPTPTGSVVFFDGSTSNEADIVGTAPVDTYYHGTSSNGDTFCESLVYDRWSSAGHHSITAIYLGDGNFAETSTTVTLLETGSFSSAVEVTAAPYQAHADSTVALSALVSDDSGLGEAPTGTVTFYNGQLGNGGVQIGGPVDLTAGDDNATGSTPTTFPSAGLYTIYAVYSGDVIYESSTGDVYETIQGPGADRKRR